MKTKLITFYLEYVNNFLTVEKYAEYHNLPVNLTAELLEIGRKLNEL